MKSREQKEQEIAFSDKPIITRMMEVLEYRGYVDTDWRSETTFEEDVRPLFEKMLQAKNISIEVKKWDWVWLGLSPLEDKADRIVKEMNKCGAEQWKIVSETFDSMNRGVTIIRR